MDVGGAAVRLLGLEDPDAVLATALSVLVPEHVPVAVAASIANEHVVWIARGHEPPCSKHLRARADARALGRLLESERSSVVPLVDRDREIGHLVVPGDGASAVGALAPHVARALGLAIALRSARSDQRVSEVAAASFGALVERAPMARAFVDESLRVTLVNGPFGALVGRSPDECIGATLRDLDVPDVETAEAILRRAIKGDSVDAGIEMTTEGPLLQRRSWLACAYPISLHGRYVGGALTMHERTHAAREEARTRLLAAATTTLRAAGDETVVASLAVPALGDWAVLDVADGPVLRHVAAAHRDPNRERLVQALPTDLDRRGRPRGAPLVLATSRVDELGADEVALLLAGDPELASAVRALGEGPMLVVPLTLGTQRAALTVARIDGPAFTALEIRAAREIAETAAIILAQHRAREAVRTTRELFEDFQEVVARELRDPLTTILGRIYLAERCPPDETPRHLAAMRAAVDRTRGSLERFATAALPELARDVSATCDASDVVRDVLQRKRHALAGTTVTTQVDALTVRADRERLTWAFAVMVARAAADAPTGGLVCVRVERDDGGRALFSVSNTGAGLDAERARHAFDGLWLGDHEASALTVARATIESLGGRAWVETTPGTGAAYCFTVPLARGTGG